MIEFEYPFIGSEEREEGLHFPSRYVEVNTYKEDGRDIWITSIGVVVIALTGDDTQDLSNKMLKSTPISNHLLPLPGAISSPKLTFYDHSLPPSDHNSKL